MTRVCPPVSRRPRGGFALDAVPEQPTDMRSLRGGPAVLQESPFSAAGRPVAAVSRLFVEPATRLTSVLSQPERKVGSLPRLLRVQPAGQP
eukprot:14193151-Alexandrium_andersonii.AAC.1